MSRCPLLDLARDASAAVGGYVGMLKTHIESEWAKVSPNGFDDRLAQAKLRFEAKASMEAAADRLAEREAATEVSEPDDLWAAEERASAAYLALAAKARKSSPVFAAQQAGDASVAMAAPKPPGRVEDDTPPSQSSPSGQSLHEKWPGWDDRSLLLLNAANGLRGALRAGYCRDETYWESVVDRLLAWSKELRK